MAETLRIKMPDGSITEVPKGLSDSEIDALLRAETLQQAPLSANFRQPPTGGQAFGENMLRQFGDNMLNVPRAGGRLAASGLANLAGGVRTLGASPRLAMQGQDPMAFFGQAVQDERGKWPASQLANLPSTTTMDLQAMMQPGNTDQNREQILANLMQLQQQHPGMSRLGQAGGDVATLLSGRIPVAKALRNQRYANPVAEATAPQAAAAIRNTPPTWRNTADRMVNAQLAKKMKRGFMRAGETGLEGATIAALNDNDPMSAAMYSAGLQSVGSLALSLTGNKTGMGLTSAALVGMTFHQMLKDATPGGKDYILESIETSYEHLTALLAVGLLAGMGGMGRSSQQLRDEMPIFAEMLTGVSRGGILSFVQELADPRKDTETAEAVFAQLSRDPEYFGTNAGRRLGRAMTVEDVSIYDTLDDLMESDRNFQKKVDELVMQRRELKAQREMKAVEQAEAMGNQSLASMPSAGPQGGQLSTPGVPPGANPLGVPEGMINAAVSRAEGVSPGQAVANANNTIAQQTASRILATLDSAEIPDDKKRAIREAIGDPAQATEETLKRLRALVQ